MKRTLTLMALSGLVAGCNSQSVTAQRIDPGAECPAGGVRLFLDGKNAQVVCNGTDGTTGPAGTNGTTGGDGTSGFTSLVTQTQLAAGDARCPRGGAKVESGLDSGGDGGVARDGVLQTEEVTSTTILCNGDNGLRVGSLIAPPGAAGTATIKANGADGTSSGGSGGSVRASIDWGTNGGHVKVWKTGHADATFTVPTPPAPDFGVVPLAITSDTTLPFSTDATVIDAGVVFVYGGVIAISQGGSVAPTEVTGLSVAQGVTLTMPFVPGSPVVIERSCRIDGIITGVQLAPQDPSNQLGFTCADLVLSSTSRIAAHGTMNTPTVAVLLTATVGSLVALGSIDTSGVDSAVNQAGGAGGSLQLISDSAEVYVGGSLRANGGSGSDTPTATSGGFVLLSGRTGVFNAATIESNGGSITAPGEGAAGTGGTVRLVLNDFTGQLRNRGSITANGGSSTHMGCTTCSGGAGGTVQLESLSGGVTNDAALSAIGGAGTTTGGPGGTIDAFIARYSGTVGVFGSLLMSGSLDASAGAGASAGTGGTISLYLNRGASFGAEVVLLGYASMEANGGASLDQVSVGGTGGNIVLRQLPGGNAGVEASAGAVLNTVDLSVKGGSAEGNSGGNGGDITMTTQSVFAWPQATFEVLENSGALSAAGGRGATGGMGGTITLNGRVSATSRGAVDARGGAGTTGGGGNGGQFDLTSDSGPVVASASVDVSAAVAGGGTVLMPGVGGGISMRAVSITNSGTLLARGGAGDLTTGRGGGGGVVELNSIGGTTVVTAPAPAGIVVSGGAAMTPGAPGSVSIDGFLVTSRWTH
jgi:hypothetical protein